MTDRIEQKLTHLQAEIYLLKMDVKRILNHVESLAQQSGVDPSLDGDQAEVPPLAPVAKGEEVVAEGAADLSCMW